MVGYGCRGGRLHRRERLSRLWREEVTRVAEAVFLGRDLVNTPSNDMGPEELAAAARGAFAVHHDLFV